MPITVLDAENTKLNKTNKVLYLMELPSAEDMYSTNKIYVTMYWAEINALKKVQQVEAVRNR